jgi:prophage regulatory protein
VSKKGTADKRSKSQRHKDLLASAAAIPEFGGAAPARASAVADQGESDVPDESVRSQKRRARQGRTPWEDPQGWPVTARSPPELWRLPRVLAVTGLIRSQVYELLDDGLFPRPVTLTERGRILGWPSHEVLAYVQSRIRARDTEAAA